MPSRQQRPNNKQSAPTKNVEESKIQICFYVVVKIVLFSIYILVNEECQLSYLTSIRAHFFTGT